LRMKRFYFGVIKEFRRVTWGNRNEVLKNFVIIISILFFLAVIFLGVDWCIVKLIAL
jgi:preprotein translocase SecE subunit